MQTNRFRYTLQNMSQASLVKKILNDRDKVDDVDIDSNNCQIVIDTSLSADEIESLIEDVDPNLSLSEHYKDLKIKTACDRSDGKKIGCYLKEQDFIANASYDSDTSTLHVLTSLDKDAIDNMCSKLNVNIVPDDGYKKYVFNVSIDCPECANKVECALKENPDIKCASFDFPKGKLYVTTSLSEDDIKRICHKVEGDMEFLEDTTGYCFNVSIDCADCAKKIEHALCKNPNIKNASFDFPKGKLCVITSLSETDIKKICKDIDDDIVFLDSEKNKNEKEEKDFTVYRIAISIILLVISEITQIGPIAIISYLIAGYDVLLKAFKNILKGKVFDENFLMAIATIGALAIASYEEASGVMIFYQIGEYFQRKAVGKSRKSIANLMDLSVDTCTVEKDGKLEEVKSEDVKPGDVIVVKAGEKVAIDGIVIDGSSYLDVKALTGESVPVATTKGSKVLSGSINGKGRLKIKATSYYSDSTASKIIKLVDQSEGKKAKSEKFITKFSRYYTPFICMAAILLATLPPILGLMTIKESLYRACVLLVISCPCALVLSIPLTYFASMGCFAKNGILVKGDDAIQALAKLKTLAMDKTGTLTEGVFKVQKIYTYEKDADYLIKMAASLEKNSSHPIATAILDKAGDNYSNAQNVNEIPGVGIEGEVEGKKIKAGSAKIMENAPKLDDAGTHIYVTEDGRLLGIIIISDSIRANSKEAIRQLRKQGVERIWMLSGDRKERAKSTADELGLDGAYGELLPNDKITALESLMKDGKTTGYAGDGINDAPTLKRADLGIAMGGVGSDAAIEASDAVIMNDDPEKIAIAISIAKRTETIVKENIIGSLAAKAIVFVLAIFGIANMWLGVFADTGVALLAVVNAMRALKWKQRHNGVQ